MDRCAENKEDINQLANRIENLLKQEESEKLDSEQAHEETRLANFDSNQNLANQLKALLVKINGQWAATKPSLNKSAHVTSLRTTTTVLVCVWETSKYSNPHKFKF